MGSKNDAFTLEENLALTNDELTSNWSKLASLIRSYENVTWSVAQTKARELLKEKSAVSYIEEVRKDFGKVEEPKQEEKVEPKQISVIRKVPYVEKDLYEKNYDRLLKLAPDLEERLLESKRLKKNFAIGKSRKSGYMDFNIEMLDYDKDSFYIAISHYFVQNGDLVSDPDMQLRIDVERHKVEALEFQNQMFYASVYDDLYKRELVNLKEKKSQNDFLTQWLKNLKSQGHEIVWDNEDGYKMSESEFIDEFSKKEKLSVKKAVEKKTTEEIPPIIYPVIDEPVNDEPVKEEPMKEEPKKEKPNVIHVEKLISLLMDVESDYTVEKAETKAKKIIEEETAIDYLITAYQKQQDLRMSELLKTNYIHFMFVIPNFERRFKENNELTLTIKATKEGNYKTYSIIKAVDFQKGVLQFAVYEKSANDIAKGTLLFALNPTTRQIWVTICSLDFHGFSDYSFDSKDESLTENRYQANRSLAKWIYFLITKGYKEPSEEITTVEIEELKTESAESKEKTPEQQREDWLNGYKENAKKMPDFELGKVEYTEIHKKAGVTKRQINWINKHKQGMVLIPKSTMTDNTKSESADKKFHAKKPGMRISKFGKIYYEGRSNRSDLTNDGL